MAEPFFWQGFCSMVKTDLHASFMRYPKLSSPAGIGFGPNLVEEEEDNFEANLIGDGFRRH